LGGNEKGGIGVVGIKLSGLIGQGDRREMGGV
jgi:hypothetical protein